MTEHVFYGNCVLLKYCYNHAVIQNHVSDSNVSHHCNFKIEKH